MSSPAASVLVELEVRIVPEAEGVRLARGLVRSLMADHGFGSACVESAVLGLDEVLMNACLHAGSSARGEEVELAIALERDRILFEVRDRGRFAAENGRAGARLPGDDSESGRGLFLIHATMDEVCFERREGGGTRVRLVKRR